MVNGWYKLLLYKELMTAEQMVRSLSVNDARNFVNTEQSVKTERKRSTNAIGRKQWAYDAYKVTFECIVVFFFVICTYFMMFEHKNTKN